MRRAFVSLPALVLVACGAAPPEATVSPSRVTVSSSQVAAEESELDWARLLPIETATFFRVDLARLRRSPHYGEIEPLLEGLFADVERSPLNQAIESLLERTDLLMLALLVHDEDGHQKRLLLARGDYREDELERLGSSAGDGAVRTELSDPRVWVSRSPGSPKVAAQLRRDTIVVTDTEEEMERLIARTRMTERSPRWPPSMRPLIEASELEEATIGLVIAGADFSEDGVGPVVSLAGRADLDGPLAIETVAELNSPETAALFGDLFYNELVAAARRAEGVLQPLRELENFLQVDMDGPRLIGRLRADREASERLIPALLQVFRGAVGATAH